MNKNYSLSTSANFEFFLQPGIYGGVILGPRSRYARCPLEGVFDWDCQSWCVSQRLTPPNPTLKIAETFILKRTYRETEHDRQKTKCTFGISRHEQESSASSAELFRGDPHFLINFKNYYHIVWRLILRYKLYRILMKWCKLINFWNSYVSDTRNPVILYIFLYHLFKSCIFLIIADFHKEK